MSFTPRTPTHSDVVFAAMNSRLKNVYVATPARVERFDSSTQVADVQPLLLVPTVDEDGNETTERLPVIPNVPVIFPRGSGFHLVFPIAVGDNVMVVFCDQSLDLWKARGGEVNPVDLEVHAQSGAVCYPGLYPSNAPVPSFPSDKMVVGKDGITHSPAARKNDAVKVTIPAGSFLISCSGSPAVGVLNPTSIDVTGTITAGSGNVEIAD